MDAYRGQQILITGGLGFIGSNLAIRLVESGASVTILDSLDPTGGANGFNIEPIRKDVTVIEGSSGDFELMQKLVRLKSCIFSLAGHVSHIESMHDPFSDLYMNAVAPLTVLEACRQENREARIIYSGTRQCYGPSEVLPLIETQHLKPIDVNGVNKMAGEQYHSIYHLAHGMPTVSLRLVNTYGPRQLVKHSRQGFAGWFIRQAIEGKEIQIYGDGQQLRDLDYIDDVVDAFLIAGASEKVNGDCFNLGGLAPVTLESFVKTLLAISGRGSYRIIPFPPEQKAIDIGSIYSSYQKFNSATGWAPEVTLEEGLARTIEYYRRNQAHYW
jgi:UDP-glucose 4-epimerase